MGVLALGTPAKAIDGSAIQRGPGGWSHLVMPTELTRALADSLPGFRINADSMYADSLRSRYRYTEHEAPFALIADLNGDGREDLLLDGMEGPDRVAYFAWSEGKSYRFLAGERVLLMNWPGRSARPFATGLFWLGTSGRCFAIAPNASWKFGGRSLCGREICQCVFTN